MATITSTGADGIWGVKNGAGRAAHASNIYKFPTDTDNEALATGGKGAMPPSGTMGAIAGAGGAATAILGDHLGAVPDARLDLPHFWHVAAPGMF